MHKLCTRKYKNAHKKRYKIFYIVCETMQKRRICRHKIYSHVKLCKYLFVFSFVDCVSINHRQRTTDDGCLVVSVVTTRNVIIIRTCIFIVHVDLWNSMGKMVINHCVKNTRRHPIYWSSVELQIKTQFVSFRWSHRKVHWLSQKIGCLRNDHLKKWHLAEDEFDRNRTHVTEISIFV